MPRHFPAMPTSTLHRPQENGQYLLTPPISPPTQFQAGQTPSRLQDWTDGPHSVTGSTWPDYALPKANVPSATAENLRTRLARLERVQSIASTDITYAVQERDWSREIQMDDSAVWMTLIRSRWLVIETLKGHLQLWDIEGTGGVLGSFSTLVGSVDGAVVTEEAGKPVEFFVSTTEYRTYSFILDLPHQSQDHKGAYVLAPRNELQGFSSLKDKKEGWWAFARSKGTPNQGFLSVPHANTILLVRLAATSSIAENQNVLDVLLHDDIVVVARNRSLDIYRMPDILERLSTNQSGLPTPFIRCEQSLSIPYHPFIHHTRLLRRAPAYSKSTDPSIFCSMFTESGWLVSRIGRDETLGSATSSSPYSILGIDRVANGLSSPLTIAWGESGSRMIEVDPYTLDMFFADARETPEPEDTEPEDPEPESICSGPVEDPR